MTEQLGPYELRGELGRGAMAVVWRAWDPKLEREVAIKEPVLPAGADPAAVADMAARFVREGKAAAALNHPGIVTIYAADVYDGRPAIVMELIEGETLAGVLARGPLSPASSLAVLDQLLDAAGYAHARSVVHRDIKPDNIFVTLDGRVKLADFGIAHTGTTAALTQAGTVMGTPGYMAPEQITGQPLDARADIFAIGVLGHELLTGRNPFGATEGVAPTTIMYRIVHEAMPQLPASVSAGLPGDIARVLTVATAKDPAYRFGEAQAFRAALHGGPIATAPGTTAAPSWAPTALAPAAAASAPSSTNWTPYLIVGAIGVVAVGLLFVFAGGPVGGRGTGAVTAPASPGTSGSGGGTTSAGTQSSPTPHELTDGWISASSAHTPDGSNTYDVENALDGDPETSWQEGASGYGIGEWLRVDFSTAKTVTEIRMIPGYLKDIGWDRWEANGRVKGARFTFSDGSYKDWTFGDQQKVQAVVLTTPVKTMFVKMTIRSVYKAKKVKGNGPWDDTSVSEINIFGLPAE